MVPPCTSGTSWSQGFRFTRIGRNRSDRVVAIGAALRADILVGNKPGRRAAVTGRQSALFGYRETMGGLVEKIIPRNTTIPVARARARFTRSSGWPDCHGGSRAPGEARAGQRYRSLARFELRGIPPMVAIAAHIRVTFAVDADGLLSVRRREHRGIRQRCDKALIRSYRRGDCGDAA